VRAVGCAIVGQTADLAPADRRIYSVRDVTATVESIPLIAASILSKKLAAGLGALVMDVKVGSGAFMPTRAMSRELARTIMRVGQGAGLPTQAILTDMNQALAPAAGNALEVRVALDYLRGDAQPERLNTVTLALGSEALLLSGVARDGADARARLSKALASGRALETFARMVSALGGPHDLAERPDLHLASAPVVRTVSSGTAGWIASIDTRALGMAVVAMGGGRARAEDHIDPRVGLANLLELGARVEPDTPIAMVHAASEDAAASAAARVRAAYRIGERSDRPVLLEKVTE
jgi:thymidine phosphorylase